jgi:TonB family protein
MVLVGLGKRACIGLCLFLGLRVAQGARKPQLDALSQQLGNEIVKAKLRCVIVVDFLSEEGKSSTLGWYLADELSENWLAAKQKFRVRDRSELKDVKIAPEDLNSQMIERLGSVWGVDAILTGVVQNAPEKYTLSVSVRRVKDNSIAATETVSLPHTRILDVLQPTSEMNNSILRLARAGINGVDVPRCISCPIPTYTDRARKERAQGTIILSVVVSENGRAGGITIVKGLGFGLTQKAIEAVSQWHFKPATKEGEPVAVMVPIEVTMRLY